MKKPAWATMPTLDVKTFNAKQQTKLAAAYDELAGRAKDIKFGRTLSPMAVDLYDQNEKHVAVAQVNYFVLGKT